MTRPRITQRDLQDRSEEVMDAVERGQSFAVTRDGKEIGALVASRRSFVSKAEFVSTSHDPSTIDVAAFRTDQAASVDQEPADPRRR